MSAPLKEIIDIDTRIKPEMDSWSSLPDGFELLIKDAGEQSIDPGTGLPITAVTALEFSLLIDDSGNVLLIQ